MKWRQTVFHLLWTSYLISSTARHMVILPMESLLLYTFINGDVTICWRHTQYTTSQYTIIIIITTWITTTSATMFSHPHYSFDYPCIYVPLWNFFIFYELRTYITRQFHHPLWTFLIRHLYWWNIFIRKLWLWTFSVIHTEYESHSSSLPNMESRIYLTPMMDTHISSYLFADYWNYSQTASIRRICVGYTTVWSWIYECNECNDEPLQIDDLTAGVGVSYDPLSHSRHNGEV